MIVTNLYLIFSFVPVSSLKDLIILLSFAMTLLAS